jgi:cell division septum initiation protein DivIVA
MSVTIETDLKEILDQINHKLEHIQENITDIKISQTELKGEIKALDTKVEGLSMRIQNQEFTSRAILGSLVLVILGSALKMFGFLPPTN